MSQSFTLSSGIVIDPRARVAMFSDALDLIGLREQVMSPVIKPLESNFSLYGYASTLQFSESEEFDASDPYSDAIDFLDQLQPQQCVVISTGMAQKSAFWGELFTTAALGRGATGLVCDGPIRDTAKIREIAFPTFSFGTLPFDYKGRMRVSAQGSEVICGGVRVHNGDLIVADRDGIAVIPSEKIDEVVSLTNKRVSQENVVLKELQQGLRVREVWDRHHVL